MGKKAPKSSVVSADVRAKAQAMRLEQERAEKRLRNIIVAVVAGIVAVVIALVAWVVSTNEPVSAELSQSDSAVVLGDFADGAPIVVSHKGLGVKDESLPTLTEYFDYSCPACIRASTLFGGNLLAEAQAGLYNLEVQPVVTHNEPWNSAATTASLVVAQKAPEKWVDFHHGLMAFADSEIQAGRGQVLGALLPSSERVKVIATEVGVPQDVVDSIPVNAVSDYMLKSTAAWGQRSVEGRERLATPEFVVSIDGQSTKVNLTTFEPNEVMDAMHSLLKLK